MPTQVNTQRIAKNTLPLYGRMLLIMAVSLDTSRVVLNMLGVEDYGIYNVVGGIVTMSAFLKEPMVKSAQRCQTFESGKISQERFKDDFTTGIHIHASEGMGCDMRNEIFNGSTESVCEPITLDRSAKPENWSQCAQYLTNFCYLYKDGVNLRLINQVVFNRMLTFNDLILLKVYNRGV